MILVSTRHELELGKCKANLDGLSQRQLHATDLAPVLRSLLSACFAEQHGAVENAFCQEQYCSALVMHHCRPV